MCVPFSTEETLVHSLTARIVVVLAAAAVLTAPAHAQQRRGRARRAALAPSRPEFGAHLGYSFEFDQPIVGAQASFPLSRQVEFYPSFDYYSGDAAPEWAVNVDLKVRSRARNQFGYGGLGLNLLYAGGTTTHLNTFVGFAGPPGGVRPYAEGRLTLFDGSAFQFVGGLSFPLP
jgi:hypothetical protein